MDSFEVPGHMSGRNHCALAVGQEAELRAMALVIFGLLHMLTKVALPESQQLLLRLCPLEDHTLPDEKRSTVFDRCRQGPDNPLHCLVI